MQADVDLRVGLPQPGDRGRQHVAGLRVCSGYRQCATVLGAVLLANAFEVANFTHDEFDAFEDKLTRLGDAFKPLAVARKNLDAELFFKLDDRFGDTWLRRV